MTSSIHDPHHHVRTTCRACAGDRLTRFLDLGRQPLANAFLDPSSNAGGPPEPRYPLDVYFCHDCSLVQLLDVIDPAVLFRNYIYVTGTSETMARHNVAYASEVVQALSLAPSDLVVEVASNDGSLLACFQGHGVRVLGIEPARNIATLATERGIPTIAEFFDAPTARATVAAHGPARAVVANNVLAHVDDLAGFVASAASLLADDGAFIVEFPYLAELLDRLEYDTIYHEHLCYFSITPLLALYERAGLAITQVERRLVHGGSLRVYARKIASGHVHGTSVLALRDQERAAGLTSLDTYESFAVDVAASRSALLSMLRGWRADGAKLAGYGAPAKGNTLLNYCGISTDLLDFTVDRSPHKVGKLTPGTHIPVLPAAALLERRPDYTLLLAWNFADEVIRQQADYLRAGGHFVLPVPRPRIAEVDLS